MVSHIDGNSKCSHQPGDIPPIASDQSSTMAAWIPQTDAPDLPERPALNSQQSNSLPSTPYQHARNLSFHSRSPSPVRGSTSPRSTHSESTHLPRKPLGACKYETAMSFFRRRIPYNLGTDILPEEKEGLKEKLEPEEEQKLTTDIMDLYDRLLPSAESDDRKRQLVQKLEKLFNDQWPGHEIKANVFGSSGNKLCSSDSDVDICITTNFKELEHVCLLAEVLAKRKIALGERHDGMQRVVCVSHAKVPIVKIWDPELKLACDMNVNNTLALENTRMIRTYVDVDERVRPLAMSVKYWTKRRTLNDAALGGTLSSYTWICLIINFLQTRNPPILPSLQARPHKKKVTPDGLVCSFDDDMKGLNGFGRKNKQSVGELFFEFFRYYGHMINYEQNAISVREGGLISKEGKGWHLLMNNRLCVEEPFSTSRNLGNTADDTSFRGLHLELRRAFKFAAKGDLEGCCEQYEFPKEEERTWERPPPQPRPIIAPAPARGGRGGGRGGGRYANQTYRGGGFAGGRRTSNTGNKGNSTFRQPSTTNANDLSLQAQQQAQFLLHDQLYQQIQLLQAQEQELRMQLHNQALITGRPPPVFLQSPFIRFPVPQEFSGDEDSRSRSGTVNHPPLTPSHRPHQPFFAPTYASVSASGTQGSSTNPSSPSITSAVPDLRRSPRRSSAASGSAKGSGSLRAQSQPARPQESPSSQTFPPLYTIPQLLDTSLGSKQRPAPESSEGGEGSSDENTMAPNSLPSNESRSGSVDENRPQDLMGYLVSPQQLQLYQQNSMLPPLTTPVGLALPNGYTSYLPIQQQDYKSGVFSSDGSARSDQTPTMTSRSSVSQPPPQSVSRPALADRGPLIVDGSVPPSEHRASSYTNDLIDPYTAVSHYTSTSDDHNINTPASFSDSLSQDFQDPGPFELEPPSSFTRPSQFESQQMINVNGNGESQSEKTNGQPELLASRLQNYHLSNAEKLAQTHASNKANVNKSSSAHQVAKESSQPKSLGSSNDKAANGSHSNEPRRQTSKRRPNGGEASEKANGVNHNHNHHHGHSHKPKAKGRHDGSHNHSSNATNESKDRHVDHPPKKAGGTTNGAAENNHGGWQTTKKKHRRNPKSTAESRNGVHNGPEPIPADESMRKGG
ncbi:PAP/25A-associated [Penicillium frequentans]|nr:PAP/25A-associated [Penicillium glabrum]